MYELALAQVISHIEKERYISFADAEKYLQEKFDDFESYYVERFQVDPFTVDFVHVVFDGFILRIKALPQIKLRNLRERRSTFWDTTKYTDLKRKIYKKGTKE